MQIHPQYLANESLQTYVHDTDTMFAFQPINKLFDKDWCHGIMDALADMHGKQVRTFSLTGEDMGDTANPYFKYYLMIF